MHKYSPSPAPIVKGDRYGDFQCPRNQYELNQMKVVPYASAVGSLQHAQVCTCPGLTFVTGFYLADSRAILEQNTEIDKESLCYLQGMKGLMMTYRRSD